MVEEVDGEMTMRTETDSNVVGIGTDPGVMTDIQITMKRDKVLDTMTDGETVVMVDQVMGGDVAGTMTTRVVEEEEVDQRG